MVRAFVARSPDKLTIHILLRPRRSCLSAGAKHWPWLTALLARRPNKVAGIALANKIARMAWAILAKDKRHKEPLAPAA